MCVKTKLSNKTIIIKNEFSAVALTLEEAKIVRDQLDEAIDVIHLKIEQEEGE